LKHRIISKGVRLSAGGGINTFGEMLILPPAHIPPGAMFILATCRGSNIVKWASHGSAAYDLHRPSSTVDLDPVLDNLNCDHYGCLIGWNEPHRLFPNC
jgi:hypothetical protein